MGNDLNKNENESSIEDQHIIFPGYSNNLSNEEEI